MSRDAYSGKGEQVCEAARIFTRSSGGGGGQLYICFFISNKRMKGADKKGLRPDTISDIISALCIPLNNDSISTRTVHLFIHFSPTMNLRKRQLFLFFFLWLKKTSGKVRETGGSNVIDIVEYFKKDVMCLRGHCAELGAVVGSGLSDHSGVKLEFQEKVLPTPRRAVRKRL